MYDLENIINGKGLNLPKLQEILDYFINGLKYIYGEDINLDQNTQDGQFANIITQSIEDIQQIQSYIFNSFDVNASIGRILDRNVAYNGIKRKKGAYTLVPIDITFDRTTILKGLDDDYENTNQTTFTISDNLGNNYYLISSYEYEYDEQETSKTLLFRAELMGKIEPVLMTINNIVTPQLGVIEVNNNSAPQQIGNEEESDVDLLKRFKNTFALGGIGAFNNIKSALLNIDNVVSVDGENNGTNETSFNGTPPHSVWLIVEGGEDDEVAETIYKTLGSGCGMRGETLINVIDVYGVANLIKFDRPIIQNYYVKFRITNKNDYSYNINDLKEYLVNNYVLKLGKNANSTDIDIVLNNANNNLVYGEIKVSNDNVNWYDLLNPSTKRHILTLNINNITIIESN